MRICKSGNSLFKNKAQFPLDFPDPTRLGVIMDQSKADEIRCLFAGITGCLEDASLIAVKGQVASIDAPSARQIVSSLRQSLQEVQKQLVRIERLSKPG